MARRWRKQYNIHISLICIQVCGIDTAAVQLVIYGFYAVERLRNGKLLVTSSGTDSVFEMTDEGEITWSWLVAVATRCIVFCMSQRGLLSPRSISVYQVAR